jgi:hypothetical protein
MTRLELLHELWAKSEPADCCPHVSHDAEGCRCAVVNTTMQRPEAF